MKINKAYKFRLYLTNDQKELINKKMEQLGTCNFMDYARKMLIDGHVIKQESRTDENVVLELKRIGNNINQIAKQLNSNLFVEKDTVAKIKMYQKEIWQLLK